MTKTIELNIPETAAERVALEQSDLVGRLRRTSKAWTQETGDSGGMAALLLEAANEVEHLRTEMHRILRRQNMSNRAEA